MRGGWFRTKYAFMMVSGFYFDRLFISDISSIPHVLVRFIVTATVITIVGGSTTLLWSGFMVDSRRDETTINRQELVAIAVYSITPCHIEGV